MADLISSLFSGLTLLILVILFCFSVFRRFKICCYHGSGNNIYRLSEKISFCLIFVAESVFLVRSIVFQDENSVLTTQEWHIFLGLFEISLMVSWFLRELPAISLFNVMAQPLSLTLLSVYVWFCFLFMTFHNDDEIFIFFIGANSIIIIVSSIAIAKNICKSIDKLIIIGLILSIFVSINNLTLNLCSTFDIITKSTEDKIGTICHRGAIFISVIIVVLVINPFQIIHRVLGCCFKKYKISDDKGGINDVQTRNNTIRMNQLASQG